MTKLMFACVAALALTACPHKSSNDSAAALSKMGEFKDKMCACKTPACATDVTNEMATWSQAMTKEHGDKPPAMSAEETKKFTAISQELAKCSADAAKVAVPTPEAPTPVAPEGAGSGSVGSATK
ncbi:MAG TPA: hypothetical protein VF403_16600 [Kofleriaceae bacterium]